MSLLERIFESNNLSKLQGQIVLALDDLNKSATSSQIYDLLFKKNKKLLRADVYKRLNDLKKLGVIKQGGTTKSTANRPAKVWEFTGYVATLFNDGNESFEVDLDQEVSFWQDEASRLNNVVLGLLKDKEELEGILNRKDVYLKDFRSLLGKAHTNIASKFWVSKKDIMLLDEIGVLVSLYNKGL